VTYNGVDANLFRPIQDAKVPNLPEVEGKKIVLYVGHFGLRKGLIYLIKAMARVVKEVPESALVCVGGVPDWLGKGQYWPYLKQVIESNNLEGKVFLIGKVPNSTLPLFYSASAVSVLPSYYEAFPKVVIEAMACGKPVVATKDGGPAEAIVDGVSRAGSLVRFGSEGDLADALTAILHDERLAERMGQAGRKRVVTDFTWERVAQRIDSMYRELFN
jgi:glycosyltransferase involved in cell wall biosynthesis